MDSYGSSFASDFSPRVGSAPAHRSRLAGIFGARAATPGQSLGSPRYDGGFMATPNGMTSLTPRSAVPGSAVPVYDRPMSPRADLMPRGAYSSLDAVNVSPRSPRVASARLQQSRRQTPQPGPLDIQKMEAMDRIYFAQQRDKMKAYMRSLANNKVRAR